MAVAERVAAGDADRGVVVCGSGVGACVAANKVLGVRASVCHDTYSAHQGVEHDDMNVLCLGSRIVGDQVATDLVDAFVSAEFVPEERYRAAWTRCWRWRPAGSRALGARPAATSRARGSLHGASASALGRFRPE